MFVWDLQVHIQSVLSVLIATLAGFGVTMCGQSVLVEFCNWRKRSLSQSNQQHGSQEVAQPDESTETADQSQTVPHHHVSERGDELIASQTDPCHHASERGDVEASHGS